MLQGGSGGARAPPGKNRKQIVKHPKLIVYTSPKHIVYMSVSKHYKTVQNGTTYYNVLKWQLTNNIVVKLTFQGVLRRYLSISVSVLINCLPKCG